MLKRGCSFYCPPPDTWNDLKHGAIIKKASEFLSIGATVGAICGATTALANFGIVNINLLRFHCFIDLFAFLLYHVIVDNIMATINNVKEILKGDYQMKIDRLV